MRVRERVVDHLREDLERHRGDVGAGERSLRHVTWAADRCREHLGVEVIGFDHRDELAHDLHALLIDVVETTDERRQQ